jgi:hypothetical protein
MRLPHVPRAAPEAGLWSFRSRSFSRRRCLHFAIRSWWYALFWKQSPLLGGILVSWSSLLDLLGTIVAASYIGEQLHGPGPILCALEFQSSRHVGLRCHGQKGDPKERIECCYKNASTGLHTVTHHVNVTIREFLGGEGLHQGRLTSHDI